MELDENKINLLSKSHKNKYIEDDYESDLDDEFETDEDGESNFDDEIEDEEDYDAEYNFEDESNFDNNPINNSSNLDNHSNDSKIVQETNKSTIDLNDVILKVTCQVGEINLSINQLQNLSIGSYITLGNLLPTTKLMVNGVSFAEGLLVDIDGRIGVKIINIIKTGLK